MIQNAQAASGHQTRVYLYDLLGRLVSETNPENATTQYVYDTPTGTCASWGFSSYPGDLVAKSDAKGNSTCSQYDALHRVIAMYYYGPDSTPSKHFIYDYVSSQVLNSKGRLSEVMTCTSGVSTCVGNVLTDELFSYSVRGELTDVYESTPHSGSTYYHVTAGFWANGALNTLSSNISGVPTQTYGVDGEGRPYSVSASSGQNPVTSTTYNLSTYTNTVNFGSGDSDVFTLDPNTGRLQGYQFNVGSNSDTGTLRWNANGSLYQLAINDTIPGTQDTQTCTYAHDDLARVASVNCVNGATNKWNQTFNYDAFGNISKGSSGPGITFAANYLLTGGGTNNQITSLSGITPTYDASGRMTYDGVHTYGWDAESKMVSVDTTTVTYDALGRMVEKNVSGTYTQIVYGPQGGKFAVMNGQTLVQAFIPLPTGAKAVYTLAGLAFYRHHDHLGSSRLATTPSRTLYSSTAYAPFGEPYAQAGTTDLSFTGQDQDTVAGMHDFQDRRFMPVQGRWLSPDPMGMAAADPTNPQSWNRYAYVVNNPLAMIDPFGDDGCYAGQNCIGGGGGGGCDLPDIFICKSVSGNDPSQNTTTYTYVPPDDVVTINVANTGNPGNSSNSSSGGGGGGADLRPPQTTVQTKARLGAKRTRLV